MTSVDRIQGLSGGIAIKVPCRVATTGPITASGLQTVDGEVLLEGDRVLRKDETDTTLNGIYEVSTGSWTRAPDFDGANDVVRGALVPVADGTVGAALVFRVVGTNPITPGTSAVTFTAAATFTTLSAYMATVLDDANAAAARATLGLAIGTDVQAYDADTAKLDVAQTFTAAQLLPAGHQVTGAVSFGYGTGAGGAITQATSRTTGVTLDKPTGAITMFSAAGAATWSFFVVTNSVVAATDTVVLSVKAGGAANLYSVIPFNVAAGSFSIGFVSVSGTAVDAPVINFAVIKGAAS